MALIIPERDRLEAMFMEQAISVLEENIDQRQMIADNAFETGFRFEKNCFSAITGLPSSKSSGILYSRTWHNRNKAVHFPGI